MMHSDSLPRSQGPLAAGPAGAYNDTDAPDEGQLCRVLVSDDRGRYEIPWAVAFRNDGWFNHRTGEELAEELFVEGWRPWQ